MLTEEDTLLAERCRCGIFDDDGAVGQALATESGVDHRGAEAAVDVDLRVGTGAAGLGGECVELVLALGECAGGGLECCGSLTESHCAQSAPAGAAGMGEGACEVRFARRDLRDGRAGHGVVHGAGVAVAGAPLTGQVAGDGVNH